MVSICHSIFLASRKACFDLICLREMYLQNLPVRAKKPQTIKVTLHEPENIQAQFMTYAFPKPELTHSERSGYGPQPPQQTASPGPNKPRMNRGPPGLATPQQNQPVPYPESPQVPRPTPPPGQLQPHISLQRGVRDARDVGNQLGDLDPQNLHSSLKKGGEPLDWWAVFNPRIPRKLDVDLVHTLTHDSVVCCIRFSNDGKYVATGCNRTAQIFEVSTGKQVAHLQDETVDKDGDLYIRSVCFSQDGRYLATGAEDKVIRVCGMQTWITRPF